jgi:uncharacterized protein (DUF362 family)/NAD-dependent dihydropyrimidine dehydrogenase PreA subunit
MLYIVNVEFVFYSFIYFMKSEKKEKINKKWIVTLARCKTYSFDEVKKAIRECLETFGGVESFVKPGQKVALKPNLLRAAEADSAVITHPSVVEAVGDIVLEAGGRPFVIDSPGSGIPYTPKFLKKVYKKGGYIKINKSIELNYDCGFKSVSFLKGKILKRFEIISPILDADVIINLPKVKAHSFTYLSCGVKNLFGVVPGFYKSAYHGRFQDQDGFGRMLIDLCMMLRPGLTICDGIVGMEGDGPSWGKRKMLGLVAASASPFLLDILIGNLIGFDPLEIHYLKQAVHEGLCPANISDVTIVADKDIEELRVSFEKPITFSCNRLTDRFKKIILLKLVCNMCEWVLSLKPLVDRKSCQGCGICVKGCPKRAIEIVDNISRINYGKCIRCYCCHELCPYGSIHLKRSFVHEILQRFVRDSNKNE